MKKLLSILACASYANLFSVHKKSIPSLEQLAKRTIIQAIDVRDEMGPLTMRDIKQLPPHLHIQSAVFKKSKKSYSHENYIEDIYETYIHSYKYHKKDYEFYAECYGNQPCSCAKKLWKKDRNNKRQKKYAITRTFFTAEEGMY